MQARVRRDSFRQREEERGAKIRRGLSPDSAAMPFDDPPDGGKADSGALKLGSGGMEPLENAEKIGHVFHIEADAVVAHEKDGSFLVRMPFHADLDAGVLTGARVLDRVRKEIDQRDPRAARGPR